MIIIWQRDDTLTSRLHPSVPFAISGEGTLHLLRSVHLCLSPFASQSKYLPVQLSHSSEGPPAFPLGFFLRFQIFNVSIIHTYLNTSRCIVSVLSEGCGSSNRPDVSHRVRSSFALPSLASSFPELPPAFLFGLFLLSIHLLGILNLPAFQRSD